MLEDIKGVPRSSSELGVETFEIQKTQKFRRFFRKKIEGLRVSPGGFTAICKSMFGPCQFLQPFPLLWSLLGLGFEKTVQFKDVFLTCKR